MCDVLDLYGKGTRWGDDEANDGTYDFTPWLPVDALVFADQAIDGILGLVSLIGGMEHGYDLRRDTAALHTLAETVRTYGLNPEGTKAIAEASRVNPLILRT